MTPIKDTVGMEIGAWEVTPSVFGFAVQLCTAKHA